MGFAAMASGSRHASKEFISRAVTTEQLPTCQPKKPKPQTLDPEP